MLFNSPVFLFLFLPLVLLFYNITPKKFKNLLLLLASVAFYTWGEKELVLLILLSALIDYCAGLIIAKGYKKFGLALSLIFNLGILIFFKYSNFVATNIFSALSYFNINPISAHYFYNIVLPLGISFYTFQTLSYTIDVYRGKVEANRNFIDFAMYVTLFPQLIAGPIIRYKDISKELKSRVVTSVIFAEGIERFVIGLAKKMIIANHCAFLADGIFNLPAEEISMPMAWLGAIAYSFQIYYDFSGYSDMAIGLGKLFGFNFPENFNFPYAAKSMRDFWRRWHMTLSNWFKDYLYISLGGNRLSNGRTYFNLLIVFLLTGLWHGANWTFIVWGVFHGTFLIFERLNLKLLGSMPTKILNHIYVLLVLLVSWIFFRSNTIQEAIEYICQMFSLDFSTNVAYLDFYLTTEVSIALLLAILFSIPKIGLGIKHLFNDSYSNLRTNQLLAVAKVSILLLLTIVSINYVAVDSYNPFIYFRF